MHRVLACLLTIALTGAVAQDERRVSSPDGQLEFRILIAQPENGALFRLAYQVHFRGKPLVDTSFLGLNISSQEPVLGENVGLTSSRTSSEKGYNALVAEYMQNGSIGRRINVEVRAANDGIAFRYVVPRSTPLQEILIEDEMTEFDLAGTGARGSEGSGRMEFPIVVRQPEAGSVAITEVGAWNYPRASLERESGTILITRLAGRVGDSHVAFEGTTPLVCPWRVVIVGLDRERLGQAQILQALAR
ncbi:MAG TPA: glycoside hydrolase family 97 N-terminal domain-containing protein [Bryobacteraceae bacterium]|jgi:alpha-glucosidase